MNGNGRKPNNSNMRKALLSLGLLILCALGLLAQQPQTDTAPIYAVNSKYVNGVAPGYYPTKGATTTLNLSAGTAFCNGLIVTYIGGTLVMANPTNYVYLDSITCVPTVGSVAFSSQQIPIAKVIVAGGVITTITDDRTPFNTFLKPGYFPTAGAAFTLNIAAGGVSCNGTVHTYAGGTLAMVASQTNYVYLDPSVACIPVTGLTVWTQYMVPIAVVTTDGSAITAIVDDRELFTTQQEITVAGNTPLTASLTGTTYTISCSTCESGPLPDIKGSIVGAATCGASVCSGVGLESVPFFHIFSAAVATSGPGDAWPIPGSFRNIALRILTTADSNMNAQLGIGPFLSQVTNPTAYTAGKGLVINSDSAVGGTVSQNSSEYWHVDQAQHARFAVDFRGATAGGFTSPGYTAEFVSDSGRWSVLGDDVENPPTNNATEYASPYNGSLNSATEANYYWPIPIAGTMQYFLVSVGVVGTNSATATFTLRKGTGAGAAADSTITVTAPVSMPAGLYHDNTNTVSVAAGDYIDFKSVNASAGVLPTVNQIRVGFNPADGVSTILGGAFGQSSIGTTTQFFRFFSRHSDSTEARELMVMPRAGTASHLYVTIGTAITAPHVVTVTLRRCPLGVSCADTPITCALNNASGTGAIACDVSHTQAFAATDAFCLSAVSSAGTESGLSGFSMVY